MGGNEGGRFTQVSLREEVEGDLHARFSEASCPMPHVTSSPSSTSSPHHEAAAFPYYHNQWLICALNISKLYFFSCQITQEAKKRAIEMSALRELKFGRGWDFGGALGGLAGLGSNLEEEEREGLRWDGGLLRDLG